MDTYQEIERRWHQDHMRIKVIILPGDINEIYIKKETTVMKLINQTWWLSNKFKTGCYGIKINGVETIFDTVLNNNDTVILIKLFSPSS